MTNKKQKLEELLNKLKTLENKEILPDADIAKLTDSMIEEEVSAVTARLKENPTIKILQKFSAEISKFKKDFDLKPVIESINGLEDEIKDNQSSLITEFKGKLQELKNSIPDPTKPFDPSSLLKDISSIRKELQNKQDFDPTPLKKDLDDIKSQFKNLLTEVKDETKDEEQKKEVEKKILRLKQELMTVVSDRHGGGNMNRAVYVNGSNVLSKYTDINWKDGTGTTITAVNNNTTKFVDITIDGSGSSSLVVGTTTITGGTTTRILYDNAGVLGEYTVTGTGTQAVLSISPTISTFVIVPKVKGGTSTSSTLRLYATGAASQISSSAIIFAGGSDGGTEFGRIDNTGNFGIGVTAPTAVLHLKAGSDVANGAPFKFTSGALTTGANITAGSLEFLTDNIYFTITTGAARKNITLSNNTILLSGTDGTTMTFPAASETFPAHGTSGNVMVSNGTIWTSAAPAAGGITITEVTGTTQTAVINAGYITNNAGLVTVTLPTTAVVGSVIEIYGSGAGGWAIAQNASGQIIGDGTVGGLTTVGVTGTLTSTNRYDTGRLVCITANNVWSFSPFKGNPNYT